MVSFLLQLVLMTSFNARALLYNQLRERVKALALQGCWTFLITNVHLVAETEWKWNRNGTKTETECGNETEK